MQELARLLDSIYTNAIDYGRTTIEITKLKAVDKASDVISTNIPRLVLISLTAFALLFLNLGLAFWLSDILGRVYLGFMALGGFYLLLGLLLHLVFRKKIAKVIRDQVIRQLLK
jgi:membrane-bound ClpP family serine protease